MIRAFRALGKAIKDVFEELLLLIMCNLIWALISLPLLLAAYITLADLQNIWLAVLLSLLAVLPMAPATAGLYVVAHRTSEGRVSKIGDFFGGMRRYALPAWRTLGIWMIGFIIILVDLQFYAGVTNFVGSLILGLWFWLLVIWLGLLIYIFPLILLQEQPSLRIIARNAFLMTLGRPIFTLITLVLMGALVLICVIFPLLTVLIPLILVALLAQWSMRATQELIKEAEERQAAAQAKAEAEAARATEEKGRRGQVRPK